MPVFCSFNINMIKSQNVSEVQKIYVIFNLFPLFAQFFRTSELYYEHYYTE